MTIRINKKSLFLCILFIGLLFTFAETRNDYINTMLGHIDEAMECLGVIYIVLHLHSLKNKENNYLVILWNCFLFVGFIGSIIWHKQNIIAILQDMFFGCSKFIVAYFAAMIYFKKNKIKEDYILQISKIIVVTLTVFSIHDFLFDRWFDVSDFRFFFNTQKLMFAHATYLTHAAVTLLIVILYFKVVKNKKVLPYMIMCTYLIVVAMRSKGVAFAGMFWTLYFFAWIIVPKQKKVPYIVGGILAVFIGAQSFFDYFLLRNQYSPRKILFVDSLRILKEVFPIGLGFGAYGSATAAKFYSPKYIELGYENYWGMGIEENMFLTDNFWPCIFGQFGIIGLILFLLIIGVFIKKALKIFKMDKDAGFILSCIMLYMLISSLAETSFFNPTSYLLFSIWAYIEVNNSGRKAKSCD